MIVTTNTTIIHASHFAIEWKKIQDMAYIEVMVLYCQKSRGNYSLHLHSPSGFFFGQLPPSCSIIIHASVGVFLLDILYAMQRIREAGK